MIIFELAMKKLITYAYISSILSSVATAATSTFSLASLSGPVGTSTGTLTSSNVDAMGGTLTVTVTSQVVGTGNSLHATNGTTGNGQQPANSGVFGYIFGSGNNTVSFTGNNATTLASYTALTLSFSEPVTLNSLILRDIDAQTSTFRDTTWVEALAGVNPVTVNHSAGSDIESFPWAGTTAYRANSSITTNQSPANAALHVTASTVSEISELTIFVNNSETPSDTGSHGIDIGGAISVTIAPIPEPSSTLLVGMAAFGLVARRRR